VAPTRQQLEELDALLQRMLDLPVNQGEEPEAPEQQPPAPPARERPMIAPPASRRAEAPPLAEGGGRRVRLDPAAAPSAPLVFPPVYTTADSAGPSYRAPVEEPPPGLGPRLVQEQHRAEDMAFEEPVPGGRHDLEEDTPVDPTEDLARLRARLEAAASASASQPEQEEWVPLRSSWQPSAQTWKPLAERWGQAQPEHTPPPEPPIVMPPRPAPAGPVVMTQTAPEPAPAPAPAPAPPPRPIAESKPPRPWPLLPLVWFNAAFDVTLLPWGPLGRWLRGPSGRALLGTVGILCLLAAAALVVADRAGWGW
jgi:hypothetical protein